MLLFEVLWHRTLRRPYKLATQVSGQGRPVVLLHGLASDGRIWQPLVKRLLAGQWRVVVPDLLGFGNSPKPEWNDYTVQEHARMVLASLQRHRIKGPVVLVGHSMGCLVASHIAWRYPELVERLVLYEPPLFADDPQYKVHTQRRLRYFSFYEYLASQPHQWAFAKAHIVWRIIRRIVGFKLNEEQWVPFERSLRNTIMAQTAYRELHDVSVPTDIIHGRFDFVVVRAEVEKMFQHNPHVALHVVTDMHGLSARSARYIEKVISS
jgi:pimeloyl-ACP methyl ester carboxylesterase